MIKIALLDGWPNLEENAELEFINRFIIAAGNMGDVMAQRVVTSDDIYDFCPDAVLVSHEYSRKLTCFPTIGLMWSPLSFFVNDEYRKLSVRSYDGYIAGNASVRNYVEDIQFSRIIQKPISDQYFLPTSYETSINALDDIKSPSLCYLGVHWDGNRHAHLFRALTQRNIIKFYGPPAGWKAFPDHYGGMIPFDGKSVQKTIADHGVSLCLHKKEHRQQNTPSMRIFETLSVGALPICDQIEFARTELSDIALFIDTTRSPKNIADQIEEHMQWIRDNPEQASERARRGKIWFDKNWSLESKIRNVILPMINSVVKIGMFKSNNSSYYSDYLEQSRRTTSLSEAPDCEVILRTGGRDLKYLQRAVDSVILANSDECTLGLIIVDYKSRDDIRIFVDTYVRPRIRVRYLISDDNGFRSTALWKGMYAVVSPLMAHLDDDDTVHPNHYRQLKKVLLASEQAPMAYSGVIKKEDDQETYFQAVNFNGPKNQIIEETRDLFFLSDFDISRLAQFDNYIQSNTWMARTELIQNIIGDDPRLEVVEDVYLYLLMAQRGAFAFTSSATAVWHWRSSQADNSMTSVSLEKWSRDAERVARRLENVKFQYIPDLLSLKILKPVADSSIVVGENSNSIADLHPLVYDFPIEGGTALSEIALFKGFHHAESSGVWSKELVSEIIFKLDPEACRDGGEIIIEYISSDTGAPERFVEFSINKTHEIRKLEINGWNAKQVSLFLSPGSNEECCLLVKIDSLFVPSKNTEDNRNLGIHIRSIILISKNDQTKSPDKNLVYTDDFSDYTTSEYSPNVISNTITKSSQNGKTFEILDSPMISYYKSGFYSHVSIFEMRQNDNICICKLQDNAGNLSIQFDIINFRFGEYIEQKYIELDNTPVFRIYLNGNLEEIKLRIRALPIRLRKIVYEISLIEMRDVLYTGPRDSIGSATEILHSIKAQLLSVPDE